MKNIIVRVSDTEGQPFPHADVTARYTATVVLTDGTVIPTAIKPKGAPAYPSGPWSAVSFDVYASDDPDVDPDHHGFGVEFVVSMRPERGDPVTWRTTVTPLDAMPDTLTLGDLLEMEQA